MRRLITSIQFLKIPWAFENPVPSRDGTGRNTGSCLRCSYDILIIICIGRCSLKKKKQTDHRLTDRLTYRSTDLRPTSEPTSSRFSYHTYSIQESVIPRRASSKWKGRTIRSRAYSLKRPEKRCRSKAYRLSPTLSVGKS